MEKFKNKKVCLKINFLLDEFMNFCKKNLQKLRSKIDKKKITEDPKNIFNVKKIMFLI